MLYIVALVVVAAFALLVTSLVTAATVWAWISVAASVTAAAMLIVDWWLRRRARVLVMVPEQQPPMAGAAVLGQPLADADSADADSADADSADAEPPEEVADQADVMAVAESTVEVLVVDERPRYHLDSCGWLGERETVPLPLRQARELGFTACAMCSPNATVAGRVRRSRSSSV